MYKPIIKNVMLLVCCIYLILATANAIPIMNYNFDNYMTNNSYYSYAELIKSDNLILQINTLESGLVCKYSKNSNTVFSDMEGSFDLNYQNTFRKSFNDLSDGTYFYYIKCKNGQGNISGELQVSFGISRPVTAKIDLNVNDSYVGPGITKVSIITSKILSTKPTLTYSLDGSNYDPIALTGSNANWYGYMFVPADSGEVPGSFRFRGIDLDGSIGEDITDGEIFLVDTNKPKGIVDIRVVGQSNSIRIDWYFDEEVSHYNIYRNSLPNIDYSDFYSDSDENYFIDKNVEKGKTYYYKISAVDKAGNEGQLSFEFSVNSLISNSSSANAQGSNLGLSTELLSEVDGLLADIDSVSNSLNEIKERFESDSKQIEIYKSLKLEREIDSSSQELDSLVNEVESYKKQTLTQAELDRKLNNARLKMNVIKKKIPESIIVISEKKIDKNAGETEINEVLLNIYSAESDYNKIKILTKSSLEIIKKNPFSTSIQAYNLEIGYIDGTKKSLSLIMNNIKSSSNKNMNASIMEFIPKEIAQSSSEIDIKNTIYDIIKDDPIISFPSDTIQISYVLNKNIDLNLINGIKTVLIVKESSSTEINSPSGFFSSFDSSSGGYFGIGFGIFLIIGLLVFLIYNSKKKSKSELIEKISYLITEAKIYKKNGQNKNLIESYKKISTIYKELDKNEKKEVFEIIQNIFDKSVGK